MALFNPLGLGYITDSGTARPLRVRGHGVFMRIKNKPGWGATKATSYCLLRSHGVPAGCALRLVRKYGDDVSVRDRWKVLPMEMLSSYDRIFLLRSGRRKKNE